MRSPLPVAALLVALPAGAVTIDWLTVGDPGNPPDTATNCPNDTAYCGSVAEAYRISKYEIKSAQYADFLNALRFANCLHKVAAVRIRPTEPIAP